MIDACDHMLISGGASIKFWGSKGLGQEKFLGSKNIKKCTWNTQKFGILNAEIAKFGLILHIWHIILRANWEGRKKIFLGKMPPFPPVAPPLVFVLVDLDFGESHRIIYYGRSIYIQIVGLNNTFSWLRYLMVIISYYYPYLQEVTAYRDRIDHVCFLMKINTSITVPPKNLLDFIVRYKVRTYLLSNTTWSRELIMCALWWTSITVPPKNLLDFIVRYKVRTYYQMLHGVENWSCVLSDEPPSQYLPRIYWTSLSDTRWGPIFILVTTLNVTVTQEITCANNAFECIMRIHWSEWLSQPAM